MPDDRRSLPDSKMGRRSTDTFKVENPATILREATETTKKIQRLTGAGFAFFGLLFIFASLTFFFGSPETQSPVSQQLSDAAEDIWNAAWGLGGLLVIYGVFRPGITVELVGQFMCSAALTVYCVALLVVVGPVPGFFLAVILLGFCGLRQVFLVMFAPRLTYVLVPKTKTKS